MKEDKRAIVTTNKTNNTLSWFLHTTGATSDVKWDVSNLFWAIKKNINVWYLFPIYLFKKGKILEIANFLSL